jgi:hypothetical protein
MNIWLDDERRPNPNIIPASNNCSYKWTWIRDAKKCIDAINTGNVRIISLDHDLGGELTGYDVAKHIEKLCYEGKIRCPVWTVHSKNIIGTQNIKAAMINARYYSEKMEIEMIERAKENYEDYL